MHLPLPRMCKKHTFMHLLSCEGCQFELFDLIEDRTACDSKCTE